VRDCVRILKKVIRDKFISVGGGALEAQLYLVLQDLAYKESDIVQQLCIYAWADALLTIPSAIAENAGFAVDFTLQMVS
jgi:chaperonin GroEL (HSP60 family)